MDAPYELPSAGPSDETNVRRVKEGETQLSNALETGMLPPWNVGEKRGDYLIRELLGRGRAGFVYAADDLVTHMRCAVKVLCRMSSQDLYRNKLGFRRMSPFRHPCLLRTDRIDIVDDTTVLSMEEIEGETLYAAAHQMKTLPRSEAYRRLLSLLHDFASGLATMHYAGLIHRDIKPSNLMVRRNGRGVIIDYGLVTNCDPETDPYGLRPYLAGTPRYFAPEALWDQSYTPAGDVFSLGLVMLDCLNTISGSDHWLRQGDFENWVRDEDEQGITAAVSGLDEQIPPKLRNAVAGMLSSDRSKRPASSDLVSLTSEDGSRFRFTPTQHLYGRDRELQEIVDWVRDIYRGKTGRLHIHGEPGAGKTRLLDEVERQLRQSSWVQVFRVKCRSRENHTLQVMDQIADQIASRYARRDREAIKLDPVSATILVNSFRQLRHVVQEDLLDTSSATPSHSAERLDALQAAVNLSRALRKFGPIIFIIDDAQWSDHGSNTVWDELQQDREGMLGIITSSRQPETNQKRVADKRIHIGPMDEESAFVFLQSAATRWQANINNAGLSELVEVSRCNAFRLHELAEEFRPGGILHQVEKSDDASISNLGDVDRLWKLRFERLSDTSKRILAFIVTANTPVSIAQLAELSRLSDSVDAAVTELVQQRLVHDDATGRECITIVHDKIASGLIENLSSEQRTDAHLAWAALLNKQDRPRDFAARIASHFYSANRPADALPFAITAADNADQAFAKVEAGQWHERVLPQVTGESRKKHLRAAARCYWEADLLEKSAKYYLILADETEEQSDSIRYQIFAAQLLVRSGLLEQARPLINDLGRVLNIHLEHGIRERFGGIRGPMMRLADRMMQSPVQSDPRLAPDTRDSSQVDSPIGSSDSDRTRFNVNELRRAFCKAICRPVSLLDIRSTLRMVSQAGVFEVDGASFQDRVHLLTWTAVLSSAISGNRASALDRSIGYLTSVRDRIENHASKHAMGKVWWGIACVETLAMRWKSVPLAVGTSVQAYLHEPGSTRFEVCHTRWVRTWADWHLGSWDFLQSNVLDMLEDAQRRHDAYQELLVSTGYAGNVLLMSDRIDDFRNHQLRNRQIATTSGELELVDFFRLIGSIQFHLYLQDFHSAALRVSDLRSKLKSSIIRHIGLVRVTTEFLSALVSLHLRQANLNEQTGSDVTSALESPQFANKCIRYLERQESEFSTMLASLMKGIHCRIGGDLKEAEKSFLQAEKLANQLGTAPYRLAAQDALAHLKDGYGNDALKQTLENFLVCHPERIERLYTVAPLRRKPVEEDL